MFQDCPILAGHDGGYVIFRDALLAQSLYQRYYGGLYQIYER